MGPILQLSSSIHISTYFLLVSLGAVFSLMWFLRRTPTERERHAINAAAIGMVTGFFCARLFHIFYEEPAFYLANPSHVVKVWLGGFVFYPGLIAGVAAGYLYVRKYDGHTAAWLDRASLPLGLSYAIGRLGCFFEGCCYGKYCTLPWAAIFPAHANHGLALVARHPTQLYAAGFELITIVVLRALERQGRFKKAGQLFWSWICLHAITRLTIEQFRDDPRGFQLFGFSISSIISIILLIVAFVVIARSQSCKTSQAES